MEFLRPVLLIVMGLPVAGMPARNMQECGMSRSVDRQRPAGDADERVMLSGWLDWQRATVHLKCAGLSNENAHHAPLSTSPLMSVTAVVSHLRWVEHHWFEGSFLGQADVLEPVDPIDQWQVHGLSLDDLLTEYEQQCVRSRAIVANHDLDEMEAYVPPGMEALSLRWIVNHLIEETARHLGHIDLLREIADGVRGQ